MTAISEFFTWATKERRVTLKHLAGEHDQSTHGHDEARVSTSSKKAPTRSVEVTPQELNGNTHSVFIKAVPEVDKFVNVEMKMGNQKIEMLAYRTSGKNGGTVNLWRNFKMDGNMPFAEKMKVDTKGNLKSLGREVVGNNILEAAGREDLIPNYRK